MPIPGSKEVVRARAVLKNFEHFLLRGNVIDLAVAVVMGGAFNTVVMALVKDLITPLSAAIFHEPDFARLAFTVNGSRFLYGDFINALISFLLVGLTVYFAIVLPVNALTARLHHGQVPPTATSKQCPECMSMVPVAARRCSFCTQPLPMDANKK